MIMTTETKNELNALREELNRLRNKVYDNPADYDREVITCLENAFREVSKAVVMA